MIKMFDSFNIFLLLIKGLAPFYKQASVDFLSVQNN